MIREARSEPGRLVFQLWFTADHGREDRKNIEQALTENLRGLGYEGQISVIAKLEAPRPSAPPTTESARPAPIPGMTGGGGVLPHGGPIVKKTIPGVRHLVAVASGKGGVGKSTITVNLAVGLRRLGYRIGILDADIYGPSMPTMLGVDSRPLADADRKIVPVQVYGLRVLSIGMLVPANEAIIWRGPMVMGALRQFLQDTRWGDLDVLLIDLPPGTGDAQLSLIQSVDLTGAVIVTTPQKVALDDAVRGIAMFRKLEVPLLGLVENMSWYTLPDGTRDPVFGEGGGVRTAAEHDTEVLAQIPLQSQLRASGDAGAPAALRDDEIGSRFMELAKKVAQRLSLGPVA
jgi:ATP-binding protein involved in chromosome partitioning